MKTIRKLFAVLLALCMVMLPCATAFAADVETAPTPAADAMSADTQANDIVEVTPRQSVGKHLAGGNNNFYGSGSLSFYLDSGNSWADIQAGTGGSTCTGWVSIYVKFPDGTMTGLGTISANADHTPYIEFSYCPKGTYTFYFENTTNDWIQVYADIYD